MNVGLYGHELHYLTALLARELRNEGIEVVDDDCLCKHSLIDRTNLQDIIVIHPADDNNQDCWNKIREVIIRYPDIHFYVFAWGKPKRKEGIGCHPNLNYITKRNCSDMLTEVMKLASQ